MPSNRESICPCLRMMSLSVHVSNVTKFPVRGNIFTLDMAKIDRRLTPNS